MIQNLEAELETSKSSLAERLKQMRDLQKENDGLQNEVEKIQAEIKATATNVMEVCERRDYFSNKCDELVSNNEKLNDKVEHLRLESVTLNQEMEALKAAKERHLEEIDIIKKSNEEIQRKSSSLLKNNLAVVKERDELEKAIPNLIESSELVRDLKATIKSLEDDLESKRQAIRHLQLRSNEMKKMLMKNNTNNGDCSSQSPPPSPNLVGASGISKRESSQSPALVEDCALVSEVSLEYLRHVVLKFLTSTELDKQRQMTRAVATLLQFSAAEERKLQDYLDWKMSWFGPKPATL